MIEKYELDSSFFRGLQALSKSSFQKNVRTVTEHIKQLKSIFQLPNLWISPVDLKNLCMMMMLNRLLSYTAIANADPRSWMFLTTGETCPRLAYTGGKVWRVARKIEPGGDKHGCWPPGAAKDYARRRQFYFKT